MSLSTLFKFVCFGAVLLVQLGARSFATETRILFLSSYHSEFPTATHHLEAVAGVLQVEHRHLEVVYMDTKRDPVSVSFPNTYEHIRANIQESGAYDLILSSDDNALEFLLRYKEELAGEAPVIFFGINNVELAERAVQRKEYLGIVEQALLEGNVELAFKLFPNLGTLHVIADASVSGQADLKALLAALRPDLADRVAIEDLSQSTFGEVAERLEAYPESDVILFLSAYIDGAGGHFDFLESVLWLRQHTQIPVFHPYEHGIGQGCLGGRVVSHYQMAQRATQFADDYLSGRALPENRLVGEDFHVDYFDYREVLRFGIAPSQLPSGAILLGKPLSFFTKYKAYCIAAFIIAVLMAVFGQIAALMYLRERRLLAKLRESEGQTAGLFENSYTPILLIEPNEGRILDANPAALAYYGYSKRALIRLNLAEIDGGSFARMGPALDRISNGECKSYEAKHRLLNGEQRQVEILFTCIQRQQQPVLFSIVRDTTEQRQAEVTLAAEQMRLVNILAGTNVGTWEWNVHSGEVCFNERWGQMLGYHLDELMPLSVERWKDLCHPDDLPEVLKYVDDHLSGKSDFYSCKFRMRHKDGSWIWVLDRGRLSSWLESGEPEWMYGTHLDITELKESEAALIEAKEAAEAASQAKNVFLATMSHELRTPLNPILGFTDLLMAANNLTEEQVEWLQVIKSRSSDLLLLINDILDVARIEAGRLAIEVKLTLVQDIIDDILSIFEGPSSEQGLVLCCEIAPELSAHYSIDPTRTRQILLNLVGNAIKFSSEGEIQIIARLEPPDADGHGAPDLHLIVRDHGPGIPRDKHALVFQEFQQIDSSDTRVHQGSGLGLAICKRLVELMGGRIWIDEDYQQGAEFHVRFPAPAAPLDAGDASLPADPASQLAFETSSDTELEPSRHVLIVEDNLSNAKFVMIFLEWKHFQVTYAKNGREAIDLCAKQRFDLILMDLKMPGISGCEAIRILRDRGDETPIVVLSALAPEGVRENLSDVDLSGFLQKPVSLVELGTMLERILNE